MINIHTHYPDPSASVLWRQAYVSDFSELADELPNALFSLGLHPWDANGNWKNAIEKMQFFMASDKHSRIAAIGECGLDRIKNTEHYSEQLEVFRAQIRLAISFKKPLVVHCVKAHPEILRIMKEEKFNGKFLMHGVNNSWERLQEAVELGAFLSFGKSLFSENSPAVDTFRKTPSDRLLLETDDANVEIDLVYRKAAELLTITEEQLNTIINRNYIKLTES